MMPTPWRYPLAIPAWLPLLLLLLLLLICRLPATETAPEALIDPAAAGSEKRCSPTCDQVGVAPGAQGAGVIVTIRAGKDGYPGIDIHPPGDHWDLSAHGHLEARIANTGSTALPIALRVDNAGDWTTSPWSTEQTEVKPGQTATLTVLFGYSYGQKRSFPLNPAAVTNVRLFTFTTAAEVSFRLESLVAAGAAGERPPLDPRAVRIRPGAGIILGAPAAHPVPQVCVEEGRDTVPWDRARPGSPPPDIALQVEAKGLQATLGESSLALVLPAGTGQELRLQPKTGRWDLRAATQVRMRVRNDGQVGVVPGLQVFSDGGQTDAVAAATPLASGSELELVVPFAPGVPARALATAKPGYHGLEKGTGTSFISDRVSSIVITATHEGAASLALLSLVAEAPAADLPGWLGQRPPVEGDWVKTFDEEFAGVGDGGAIDRTRWNIYGPNYWDRASHWSKDNLILGGGVVRMRFERKTGFHNDDPQQEKPQNLSGSNRSDYACGYLDTYGKWVQRYGYFEARVKLPEAPGLWPTFWMMPDRGAAAGSQGQRQDTGHGAMEMDIMEHLTRWGPHRYNIANHWDGYGKDHASSGSTTNYLAADKDGYITCGLLWTPGAVVYYGNGRELLRMESPRVSTVPSFLIFEVTTGGWENDSVDDRRLPVDYVIDYVRCWQRKDLASAADGFKDTTPSAVPVPAAK